MKLLADEWPNFKDENGKLYLIRCPECKRENYAMNVSSGICAWCGFDGNANNNNKEVNNAE